MRNRTNAHRAAVAAAIGALSQAALASGYQFDIQSIRAQGSANAGEVEAADPSTLFYNPAALTQLDGTQLTFGIIGVDPHSSFSESSATTGAGQPVSPAGNGGDYAKQAAIPLGYWSHRVDDRMTVGIGLFVPYGAKIGYDGNFAGRYYGQRIDFKSLNINPAVGFQLNEHHSIGFGVSAQYLHVTLDQNQDMLSTAGGVCLAGGGSIAFCSAAASAYAGLPDVRAHIAGDDWGFGFNIGYLYMPDDATRIGLAYRSAIKQKLRGTATFTLPDNLPGGGGSPINAGIQSALANSNAALDITTPESASLSAFHQLTPRWAVMGALNWVRHDRLQSIEINMPTAQIPGRQINYPTAWRNSWSAALGTSYQLDDHWTLRGGYMIDQTPVSSPSNALTLLPDSTRHIFALGTSYRVDAHDTIDVAYSYIKLAQANISDTSNSAAGTLYGSYHTHVNLLGIGCTHRF
ncbi:OmpP1/FadL family transporter [Paludibacterium purpuratum]|uniref:Long-chain fatty acid transport protein n=1 Tax=Paludibacterium purpuratum TaxID=1144873 RepID=A0A4R7B4F2_9NEIS|nr:OmpP1/FadL family transporter [Paludibacterium purpuratum]TDR77864.1 long-chain fatty acid transport protein [Paludibacterium purpuratum]